MEVMISINPPWADMTMSGYKPYEFRSRVLKGMDEEYPTEDITAYIYETKNKGGKGAVIGEVTIAGAHVLNYGKHYWDTLPPTYKRFLFMKYMYLEWCTLKEIKPNMKEGWFRSKKFNEYTKEIGFVGVDGNITANYALVLDRPIKYDTVSPLSDFNTAKGVRLARPPQNMFRVTRVNTIGGATC